MLTTRFSKNRFQSIMLRTTFSEKWSGTFSYNIFFGHTNKCPILKKLFLSFKTQNTKLNIVIIYL
jgi:hypothetical protein